MRIKALKIKETGDFSDGFVIFPQNGAGFYSRNSLSKANGNREDRRHPNQTITIIERNLQKQKKQGHLWPCIRFIKVGKR